MINFIVHLFQDPRELDWGKAAWVVTLITIIWAGLLTIMPEHLHHAGLVVLAAIQGGLTFAMKSRSPEARTRRNDPPVVSDENR